MFQEVQHGWGLGCSPPAQLLYLCLVQHRTGAGLANPGNERLMSMTGLSRSTLYRALDELKELKLVEPCDKKNMRGRVLRVRLPHELESHIGTEESHIGTLESHHGTDPSHIGTYKYKGKVTLKDKSEMAHSAGATNCTGGQMAKLEDNLKAMGQKQAAEKQRKARTGPKAILHATINAIDETLRDVTGSGLPKVTGKDRGMVSHLITYAQDAGHDPVALVEFGCSRWPLVRTAAEEAGEEVKSKIPTIPLLLLHFNAIVRAKQVYDAGEFPAKGETPKTPQTPVSPPVLEITTDDDEEDDHG